MSQFEPTNKTTLVVVLFSRFKDMRMNRPFSSTSVVLVAAAVFGLLASSCGMTAASKDSKLSIQFPTVASLNAMPGSNKISAQGYAWANACFIVSVTGPGISTHKSTCEVENGTFRGSIPPGGSVELDVPRGPARKLDLFAYFRASPTDLCPTASRLAAFDVSKTVRIGQVAAFDLFTAAVTVNAKVTLPNSTDNLLTQYSLPKTCLTTATIGPGSSAIVAGRAVQTGAGGTIKVVSVVSDRYSEKLLSGAGGSIKVKLTRRAGGE